MKNLIYLIGVIVMLNACDSEVSSSKDFTDDNSEEMDSSLAYLAQQTTIRVLDTDFSKGRLVNEQTLTLWDTQKMHGHLCDGLVVGFLGLREGLYQLYPDSIIDRTNTRIVAKSSPCVGDVGLYLSGGRYQFNSFYIDNSIEGLYIAQRIDNGEAVVVKLKSGVKPAIIDELGAKAVKNELGACDLDTLRKLEDDFSRKLFQSNPNSLFEIERVEGFEWLPILSNNFTKTDVLNKNLEHCKTMNN